jgi:hypothetical protein
MKTKLLYKNAMKRFSRWLDINSVATHLWGEYNPIGKIYLGLERRQQAADERDKFVEDRRRKRPGWKNMYLRYEQSLKAEYEQSCKAENLINYIYKRYLRKK